MATEEHIFSSIVEERHGYATFVKNIDEMYAHLTNEEKAVNLFKMGIMAYNLTHFSQAINAWKYALVLCHSLIVG